MLQPLPSGTIPYAAVAAWHGSTRDNVRDARTARSGSSENEPLPEAHPVECLLPVLYRSRSIVQSPRRPRFPADKVKLVGLRYPHNCQLIHTHSPSVKLFIRQARAECGEGGMVDVLD
jgi:hypothetical protein